MPKTLGSYYVLDQIGHGGTATVYRAQQPHTERQVAVKVLHRTLADDAALERFRREARLVARLENPHILPLYDFDGAHDPPYIVMRYIEGGTLADLLDQRRLTGPEILRLLEQVAAALDYAHRQGVTHRDIKPSNILLDADGNAFVTDFGIARMDGRRGTQDRSITQDGTVVGTPDYMAPEQATSNTGIDGRADIYALGIIAFEILTGQLPFEGETPMAVMLKHLHEPPPSVHRLNRELSPAIDDVIARALAKDPDQRFESAGEFALELAAALGGQPASPVAREAAAASTAPTSQRAGLHERQSPLPENKVVTALFADAAEYAAWLEARSGTAAGAMRALWDRMAQITASYNGDVVAQAGHGLLAVWGAGTAGEDDPERALRAALDLQATLRDLVSGPETDSLPLKIGVHTGLALLTPPIPPATGQGGELQGGVTGDTISFAQGLAEIAYGTILISHDTYREVRGAFSIQPGRPMHLRGRREHLDTYSVTAVKSRLIPFSTRGIEGIETRLVGREYELRQLQDAYLNAIEESETQAVTVIGEAGLGKNRLLFEFEKWIDLRPELVWLFRGRAAAALTRRPYALLRDTLSFRFEILENDRVDVVRQKVEAGVARLLETADDVSETAHFIGHLAGFDFSGSPHLAGVRHDPRQAAARARVLFMRFMAQVAALSPVIIHLDELHHADEASLDLLSALIDEQPRLRLLLVGLARPALLERRPDWGASPQHHKVALLPLGRRASRDLAREILQKMGEPPRTLRDLLVDRAEGNPLFMEELVKMLIEDRILLKVSADTWRLEESRLANLRVPPTLKGLLQARFDTLLYPEKLTLQRASVAGRTFHDAALRAMDADDDVRAHVPDLARVLHSLAQHEFIYKRPVSAVAGSNEYAFAQTMLRDLIYDSLLASQRRAYHTAMGSWLATTERADERWPAIAQHFERAGEANWAAYYFERAGDAAMKVSAFAVALNFYERAAAPAEPPPDSSALARLQLRQAEAHYRLTDYAAAQKAVQAVLDSTQVGSQLAHALALMGEINTVTGDYGGATSALVAALPLARHGGDESVLARVLYGLGDVNWRLGNLEAAQAVLEESIVLARKSNDTVRTLFALNRLGTVMGAKGDGEAEVKLYEEVKALAESTGNRDRLMTAVNNLGTVAQERGDFLTAQLHYRQALEIAQDVGVPDSIALYTANIALADAKLGNRTAALAGARSSLRRAVELGTLPWVVMGLITFAEIAHADGDDERALALLGAARRHPAFNRDTRRVMELSLAAWKLNDAMVAAGLEKGAALDFGLTVQSLINESP